MRVPLGIGNLLDAHRKVNGAHDAVTGLLHEIVGVYGETLEELIQ